MLQQLLSPFLSLCFQLFRQITTFVFCTVCFFFETVFLHRNQVDHTFKFLFSADWNLYRQRIRRKLILNRNECLLKICTYTIHFINKRYAWNVVAFCLQPNCFGLRLYTSYCAKNHHCTVQHPQGAFYLRGKIYMSRSVDNVQRVFLLICLPVAGRCR